MTTMTATQSAKKVCKNTKLQDIQIPRWVALTGSRGLESLVSGGGLEFFVKLVEKQFTYELSVRFISVAAHLSFIQKTMLGCAPQDIFQLCYWRIKLFNYFLFYSSV